jgi:monoterpene epsilon-lactone hydrolase
MAGTASTPRQIAVGGDSAGGGLTVALINRLRDAKEELLACAWLISPWLDLALTGATLVSKDAAGPNYSQGISRRARRGLSRA